MTKVITYQSPAGSLIDITPAQEREMARLGVWPIDMDGQEYCSVSHGLHHGNPSEAATALIAAVRLARAGR